MLGAIHEHEAQDGSQGEEGVLVVIIGHLLRKENKQGKEDEYAPAYAGE